GPLCRVTTAPRSGARYPVAVPGRPAVPPTLELDGQNHGPGRSSKLALGFKHVSKVFPDGTRAVEHVTFDVGVREMVAIVGPSGCGKSTLLRLASNLTAPTTGDIAVGDGNLGYVFQDATLLPWRTVQRNVELLAELAGVPSGE